MRFGARLFIAGLVVIIGIAGLLFAYRGSFVADSRANSQLGQAKKFDGPCPGPTKSAIVPDVYLRGILERDQEVKFEESYYFCNQPKHEDIVVYRYSSEAKPVFRRIVAVSGDKFEVRYNKKLQGWVLFVNSTEVKGAKAESYSFGSEAAPPLKYAEKSKNGVLGDREIIIYSAFPPGYLDSTTLGVVTTDDTIGKVLD